MIVGGRVVVYHGRKLDTDTNIKEISQSFLLDYQKVSICLVDTLKSHEISEKIVVPHSDPPFKKVMYTPRMLLKRGNFPPNKNSLDAVHLILRRKMMVETILLDSAKPVCKGQTTNLPF